MRAPWFIAALSLACLASESAVACRIWASTVLEDVRHADVVVVGRISDYRIIRDEAFRRRMLSNPRLTPEMRRIYQGAGSLLPDYARFDILVDEVLVGQAPRRLSVTWDNSTFGEPEQMARGPFLIALRRPSSPQPPLRGPSGTIRPSPVRNLFTVLQAPCAGAFIFESASDDASAVRRIIASRRR